MPPPGVVVSRKQEDYAHNHDVTPSYRNHKPDADDQTMIHHRKNKNSKNEHRNNNNNNSFDHLQQREQRPTATPNNKKFPVSILRRSRDREILLPMPQPQQRQHQQEEEEEQRPAKEALIVRQQQQQKQQQQQSYQPQQPTPPKQQTQRQSIVRIVDGPPPVEHVYSDSTAEISAITYTPFRALLFGCFPSSKLGGDESHDQSLYHL
jgi:hypothetical protein